MKMSSYPRCKRRGFEIKTSEEGFEYIEWNDVDEVLNSREMGLLDNYITEVPTTPVGIFAVDLESFLKQYE